MIIILEALSVRIDDRKKLTVDFLNFFCRIVFYNKFYSYRPNLGSGSFKKMFKHFFKIRSLPTFQNCEVLSDKGVNFKMNY